MALPMEFTGERVIPGMVDPNLMLEHLSRYHFAGLFSKGRLVLDMACGTGYGTSLMAQNAQAVLGLDLAREAVDYAQQHFSAPNLSFQVGDCRATGLAEASLDLITAFEIIEHLEQPESMLQEVRRLLAPTGVLLISTPNRSFSEEFRTQPNPFHFHEFLADEFEPLLQRYFSCVQLGAQNHNEGVLIHFPQLAKTAHKNLVTTDPEKGSGLNSAHYLIAVCSEMRLKTTWANPFFVTSSIGNVLMERDRHTKLLQEEIAGSRVRISSLENTLEERNSHLGLAQQQIEEIRKRLNEVESTLAERDAHLQISLAAGDRLQARVSELESELSRRDGHLSIAQEEIRTFKERVADLESTLGERDQHLSIFQVEFQNSQMRSSELEGVLKEKETHLAIALGEIQGLQNRLSQLEATVQERESHLRIALEEHESKSARIAALEQELESKGNHVRLLLEENEAQRNHALLLLEENEAQRNHALLLLEEQAAQHRRIRDLEVQKEQLGNILNRIRSTFLFKLMCRLPFLKGYLHRLLHP